MPCKAGAVFRSSFVLHSATEHRQHRFCTHVCVDILVLATFQHTIHRNSNRSQPVYANALNLLGTGGSGEGYCKWMCSCIAAKGWRSVVLNYRGCAGLELTSPTLYCASFTDDVHLAVEEIHHQFPNARLFAAGYSLGSLILCKYLAEAANGTWKLKGMVFRKT